MDEAKRKMGKTAEFLIDHPWCCLCGGSVPATTVEHAPPRVFFLNRALPTNTHRVPACSRCNNGSSQADQVAALVALTMAIQKPSHQEYILRLAKGVANNAPEALAMITQGESQDVPLRVDGKIDLYARVEVDHRMFTNWLNPWAAKQAYALHYLHLGKPIPVGAKVMVQWFTNAHVIEEQSPDELLRQLRSYGELRQGIKTSELEYSYKYQFDPEIGCIILMLHDSSMVMLGIFDPSFPEHEHPKWAMFTTGPERGIHQGEPLP
jgi:hypothetical protein